MSDSHEAIRNLLGTYCELMDAGAWAEVGELFSEAELVGPDDAVVARGAQAVQALYERGTRLHDDSPRTRHLTANTVIEVSGGHAAARSAYVVFQGAGGFPLQPVITGRYRDEFVRDTEGWRFARRQFFVDHLGDLSHHLTYELGS
ncbi:MAG: nuclear transport factor 2 family protein [Jatrophihabitans sp.]|uniref:nuclear transport factor 2 family protein n=1 Tax=Jatrophihabitans sp. TaxID=1932789 RepID=UPI0039142AAC